MSEANPPPIPVDLEQVEAIRAMVENSLRRAVIASLEQAGVSLVLGLSQQDRIYSDKDAAVVAGEDVPATASRSGPTVH